LILRKVKNNSNSRLRSKGKRITGKERLKLIRWVSHPGAEVAFATAAESAQIHGFARLKRL